MRAEFWLDRSRFQATVYRLMKPTAAPLPPLLQAKLELFGSAARGEFDPAHSDLDFIVHMKDRRVLLEI